MREILFKAKRLDNGEWIQGDLTQHEEASESKQYQRAFAELFDLEGLGVIMIDCTFILRVLTAIVWLANGIIRVKLYRDWGDRTNIVVASLSFVCFVLYGASAYYHFIGL